MPCMDVAKFTKSNILSKCLTTSINGNSPFAIIYATQVNRMSRSRRVLAIGGKQRILRLDMVCIETILFHLDSL